MSHNLPIRVILLTIMTLTVVGAATALFNDRETSENNQLAAGALDLDISHTCTLNQQPCPNPISNGSSNQLLFNFQDLKPGDSGLSAVNLRVSDNSAWVCAQVQEVSNFENACNESEASSGDLSCGQPGLTQGELISQLLFTIWSDPNCNQILDTGENLFINHQPITIGVLPLFDSTTGTGPLAGNQESCLGLDWQLPSSAGNQLQTDSLQFDLAFQAYQARNQPGFTCLAPEPSTSPSPSQSPSPSPLPSNTPPASPSPSDAPPAGPSPSDAPPAGPSPTPAPTLDLFFSEYVEGSSNNKAVEIYNPSPNSVDLTQYQVLLFTNGAITPNFTIGLTGPLSPNAVYVLCHNSFVDPPRTQACQQFFGSLNFNGDDTLALKNLQTNTILDVIGVIGTDPGTQWGTGLLSTADNTLVRSCSVTQGNPAGFIPASVITSEWTGFAADTFSNLGTHSCP